MRLGSLPLSISRIIPFRLPRLSGYHRGGLDDPRNPGFFFGVGGSDHLPVPRFRQFLLDCGEFPGEGLRVGVAAEEEVLAGPLLEHIFSGVVEYVGTGSQSRYFRRRSLGTLSKWILRQGEIYLFEMEGEQVLVLKFFDEGGLVFMSGFWEIGVRIEVV